MKTFGLFMVLLLACVLITFAVWRNATTGEILKMVLSMQLAYVMYRLCKEEAGD